jgi:hypothetical protein
MSNLRSGFLDFEELPSRSRCLRSRRLRSCLFFSSSGSRGLRSATEDSEFRRTRRASDFLGDSEGSAKISSSPVGRDRLPDDAAALRARIASSCDLVGLCPGGARGGTFSPRGIAEYGGGSLSPVLDRGGGGRMPLLGAGLSFSVRLSCMAKSVKDVSCLNTSAAKRSPLIYVSKFK